MVYFDKMYILMFIIQQILHQMHGPNQRLFHKKTIGTAVSPFVKVQCLLMSKMRNVCYRLPLR